MMHRDSKLQYLFIGRVCLVDIWVLDSIVQTRKFHQFFHVLYTVTRESYILHLLRTMIK